MKETLYKYRLFFFGLFIPLLIAGYVPGAAEFIAVTKMGNGYTAKWDGSGYVPVSMDTVGAFVAQDFASGGNITWTNVASKPTFALSQNRTGVTQTIDINGGSSANFSIPFLSATDGGNIDFTLSGVGDLSAIASVLASHDQTLTGNRIVTLGGNTFSFAGLTEYNGDTIMTVTPSGQIAFQVPGGNVQTHTSGSTLTVLASTETVYIDPATVLSSLTITMPTPTNNKEIEFHFGGTIAVGNPVVLALNLPVSVYGGTAWAAASGADGFTLRFNTTNSLWYFK
jgi:hypothetical protein